jgi:hypothetical protein
MLLEKAMALCLSLFLWSAIWLVVITHPIIGSLDHLLFCERERGLVAFIIDSFFALS